MRSQRRKFIIAGLNLTLMGGLLVKVMSKTRAFNSNPAGGTNIASIFCLQIELSNKITLQEYHNACRKNFKIQEFTNLEKQFLDSKKILRKSFNFENDRASLVYWFDNPKSKSDFLERASKFSTKIRNRPDDQFLKIQVVA